MCLACGPAKPGPGGPAADRAAHRVDPWIDETTTRPRLAWIRQTFTLLAVPRLATSGVRPQHADEIAAKARTSSSMQGNPVALSHDDLKAARHCEPRTLQLTPPQAAPEKALAAAGTGRRALHASSSAPCFSTPSPETYLRPPARPDPDLRLIRCPQDRPARGHQDQYTLRLPLTYIPVRRGQGSHAGHPACRPERRECARSSWLP